MPAAVIFAGFEAYNLYLSLYLIGCIHFLACLCDPPHMNICIDVSFFAHTTLQAKRIAYCTIYS